jgi:hypothetical protein
VWFGFAAISVAAFAFVAKFLPETKGLSLEKVARRSLLLLSVIFPFACSLYLYAWRTRLVSLRCLCAGARQVQLVPSHQQRRRPRQRVDASQVVGL